MAAILAVDSAAAAAAVAAAVATAVLVDFKGRNRTVNS